MPNGPAPGKLAKASAAAARALSGQRVVDHGAINGRRRGARAELLAGSRNGFADYQINFLGNGTVTVTDNVGNGGTDFLNSVELITFANDVIEV
jgi:hypothetical protein